MPPRPRPRVRSTTDRQSPTAPPGEGRPTPPPIPGPPGSTEGPEPRQRGAQHDADRQAAADTAPPPAAVDVPSDPVPAPTPTASPPAPTRAPRPTDGPPPPYPAVRGGLPEGNVEWPPPTLRPALARMVTWDAWWSGDTTQLAAAYGSSSAGTFGDVRPRYGGTGGVVGAWRRFWWGTTPPEGEKPTKLHVPLGGDIVRTSADLLFAEPVTAWCPDATSAAMLDALLDEGLHARLLEAAETAAALGGVYLVPGHNRESDPGGHAWIDAIPPDQAWPEWVGGRLAAVTLWRVVGETPDRGVVFRHLERHVPGWTMHGLYAGDQQRLGRPLPLTEHHATSHLADFVGPSGEVATGWPGLSAVYVPNVRPNPLWRRDPTLAPLGKSDLSGIEGILDALDEVYSDWMRDVRLAKGRIVVPEDFLQTPGRGQGAVFDADREAYSTLPGVMDPGDTGAAQSITLVQFAIRVDEHDRTAQALTRAAVQGAGYDPATFGIIDTGSGQAITATEVKSRQRRTFTTRDRKIAHWTPALRQILPALAFTDAVVYGRPVPVLDRLEVEFPDGVSDDLRTLGETVEVLERAKAVSVDTKVRIVHPGWDDQQVQAEVDRIGEQHAPPIELLGPGGFPLDPAQDTTLDGPDDTGPPTSPRQEAAA